MATLPIPVLPGRSRSIIQHIQITRILSLLQHSIDKIGLFILHSPFGYYRNPHQSCCQMSVKTVFRDTIQGISDIRLLIFRCCTDQHRVDQIDLRTCSITLLPGIIKRFMDKRIPVSYTHLDVYKRQADLLQNGSEARCNARRLHSRASSGHPYR